MWRWLCVVGACLSLSAGGCSSSENTLTQVLVALDADDDVAKSLSRIQIETYSVEGELVGSLSYALNTDKAGPGTARFPFSVGVVKRSSDQFVLVVTGFAGEEAVIERKLLATFVSGQVRALGIYLESPCFGKVCGPPGADGWLTLTCQVNPERVAQCESVELEETVSVAVGTELDANLKPHDSGAERDAGESAGDACDAGECGAQCSTGAIRCADERRLQRCDEQGRWETQQLCASGCLPGQSSCSACAPGSRRCDGQQPQTCRQDGSGWVDNGSACETQCLDGSCPSCTPGAAPRCRGAFIEECSASKTWQIREGCADPTPACVQGQCRVCEPNAELCQGTTRQICDAAGSAWARQSVAKDVCDAKCQPGATRCIAQVFQRCDATGAWSDPAIVVGECGVVCEAGQQGCAGTQPRTCNADGSAWLNQAVAQGVCGAACDPGASECSGTQARSCSASGQWSGFAHTPDSCGAICVPGNVRCMGTIPQGCSADGTMWNQHAPQAGTCDCSKPAPQGFGQGCGSCGGTVQCDGSCSVPTPGTFNQDCGGCGGKVQCDGTCSVPTPSTFNQDCGSCGGKVQCDGTCSVPTPPNLNENCGSCGGKVQCGGTCSVETPMDIGLPCGDCGGVRLCGGGCSVASPRGCSGFCCDYDSCGRCIECIPRTGFDCR